MTLAIRVANLKKSYGQLRAVDDISFDVERGEVFALLGPNGAGKTTSIEVLEGFLRRDAGSVEVLEWTREIDSTRGGFGVELASCSRSSP